MSFPISALAGVQFKIFLAFILDFPVLKQHHLSSRPYFCPMNHQALDKPPVGRKSPSTEAAVLGQWPSSSLSLPSSSSGTLCILPEPRQCF